MDRALTPRFNDAKQNAIFLIGSVLVAAGLFFEQCQNHWLFWSFYIALGVFIGWLTKDKNKQLLIGICLAVSYLEFMTSRLVWAIWGDLLYFEVGMIDTFLLLVSNIATILIIVNRTHLSASIERTFGWNFGYERTEVDEAETIISSVLLTLTSAIFIYTLLGLFWSAYGVAQSLYDIELDNWEWYTRFLQVYWNVEFLRILILLLFIPVGDSGRGKTVTDILLPPAKSALVRVERLLNIDLSILKRGIIRAKSRVIYNPTPKDARLNYRARSDRDSIENTDV